MNTIELVDVEKSYGSTKALAGVSLTLGTGVTGLLGPNGAGKTTLMRIVATVLAPDSGRLRCLGADPGNTAGRLAIRRKLGYFPQEPGYYTNLSAFDFVDYVAILKEMTVRRERHEEVRRVLGAVGLTDVMHKRIRALSGGMRRRVIVAQTLLGHPELLVLDEPTAGLDPEQRLRFREIVSGIAERQTVLLSTHQTEDVAALCQRVVVMDKGRVLYDGTPAAMANQAQGRVWHADEVDGSAQLSWRTGEGHHRLIGDPPPGAQLVAPTLEDAYLLLIGRPAEAAHAAMAS
ncbi:MAG TPA: ATP-binding cassette domain-containing protein [Acidimicrobiales bacterium]|nr:ATP-binding cassette domain-containing protein [Acidimicrobiales bacterium]